MSFVQVFVAGKLDGGPELVGAGRWKLFVNGKELAELEAIGEQFPKGLPLNQRVVSYKGHIDTSTLNLAEDEVLLLNVG